jgi:hypothetical protein
MRCEKCLLSPFLFGPQSAPPDSSVPPRAGRLDRPRADPIKSLAGRVPRRRIEHIPQSLLGTKSAARSSSISLSSARMASISYSSASLALRKSVIG